MSKVLTFDEKMMKRALTLAKRGKAWVAPNPMVGAVVVKDGRIVGEGYHRRFGGPHAEVNAIDMAGNNAEGSDIYVTLEPCSHYGKTPPCVKKIIDSKIKKVFAAIKDPNPMVNGKGFEILEKAGIEVVTGTLADQATELNLPYLKKAKTGYCWVTLKVAQSLDGRIAAITGHSQWITSKPARTHAHLMRATHDAVLVGAGTVIADDPSLTVRHVRGRNPIRIVLDTNFNIPAHSKLLNTPHEAQTWVFGAPKDQKLPVWAKNENVDVTILPPNEEGRVDLKQMLHRLSKRGIGALMVEGGSEIWTAFLNEKLVDKIETVIAPMIIGHGINAIHDLGVLKVTEAIKMKNLRWRKIGPDMHIVGLVEYADYVPNEGNK